MKRVSLQLCKPVGAVHATDVDEVGVWGGVIKCGFNLPAFISFVSSCSWWIRPVKCFEYCWELWVRLGSVDLKQSLMMLDMDQRLWDHPVRRQTCRGVVYIKGQILYFFHSVCFNLLVTAETTVVSLKM